MSWKTIKTNNYYYHNYKIDRKVYTFYFGRGPLAAAVARLDARERERRAEGRAERERLATIERRVVEYSRGIDDLFAAWMRLNGWYLHKGQWRKTGPITRRSMRPSNELTRLVKAEKVRREFEAGNVAELIERYGGDMARETIERIIASKTDDLREREALRRQAARVRDRHAGQDPTDIELALAERIAVTYMDVYYADQLAYSDDDDEIEGGVTFREAEYRERRRDRADRRFRAALDQLDRVRKSGASTIRQTVERFGLVG